MEFGIFNLMGSRDPAKPTAEVFAEVAEQTRVADEFGYAIAWFAEHHFSNYCLCASPLMLVAHCASITKRIRLGTAVVVLAALQPGAASGGDRNRRRAVERAFDVGKSAPATNPTNSSGSASISKRIWR